MRKQRRLNDEYRFPDFVPVMPVKGIFGDPRAVVITLFRRRKKRSAVVVVLGVERITTSGLDVFEIFRLAISGCISALTCGVFNVRSVAP